MLNRFRSEEMENGEMRTPTAGMPFLPKREPISGRAIYRFGCSPKFPGKNPAPAVKRDDQFYDSLINRIREATRSADKLARVARRKLRQN